MCVKPCAFSLNVLSVTNPLSHQNRRSRWILYHPERSSAPQMRSLPLLPFLSAAHQCLWRPPPLVFSLASAFLDASIDGCAEESAPKTPPHPVVTRLNASVIMMQLAALSFAIIPSFSDHYLLIYNYTNLLQEASCISINGHIKVEAPLLSFCFLHRHQATATTFYYAHTQIGEGLLDVVADFRYIDFSPRAVGAVVAHFPDTEGVTSSNLVSPTRLHTVHCLCGHSLVGKARPCQGRDRGFESRCPLSCSY